MLYTTNGKNGGVQRHKEAKEALKVLTQKINIQTYILDYIDQARCRQKHKVFSSPQNALEQIKEIITATKPDIIICVDMDAHPDHMCASLLFERCMGDILKSETNYRPVVYKGFAYETAYFGTDDFDAKDCTEVLETKPGRFKNNSKKNGYRLNNPVYLWNDRVRFPVRLDCVCGEENCIVEALKQHKTQNAESHAGRIVNSDACFFERRTDSLLHHANITVSSGIKEYLTDFMLVNCSDIMKRYIKFDNYLWIPGKDDLEKKLK